MSNIDAQNEPQNAGQQIQAVAIASRKEAFKRYGLAAGRIVFQIALGALGAALVMKVSQKSSASDGKAEVTPIAS
jgi:hypothetical protein